MSVVQELKEKVLEGGEISRREALLLAKTPLEELTDAAGQIRQVRCGRGFDICTIVNGKCGRCPEDCRYCAQSAHYRRGETQSYGLMSTEMLLEGAKYNAARGVLRYSIVTSGRGLSQREVEQVCESIRVIRQETDIQVCVSFGLLEEEQFVRIRQAGASRVHCNLESSARFFPQICTTHSWQDKVRTLKAARRAGLSICSGGILGLGETMEDRIDMVLAARELGVKSVPVNLLNPIPGTPLEKNRVLTNDQARRCVAIFRFLIPDAAIRLAGGRGLLGDQGKGCFLGGANAAISGDMLTTAGITVEKDMELLAELGFEARLL